MSEFRLDRSSPEELREDPAPERGPSTSGDGLGAARLAEDPAVLGVVEFGLQDRRSLRQNHSNL